jgi:hypothetical protein
MTATKPGASPQPDKKAPSKAAHAESDAEQPSPSEPPAEIPSKKPPIIELLELRGGDPSDDDLKKLIHAQISADLTSEAVALDYNVLVVYDSRPIERSDTDKIYQAVSTGSADKPILLVVDSGGGSISPAYFVAKLCREYSQDRFEVVVPRRAKSAATLICCGADKIHMGSLSELGPIDPQFDGVPALTLKHSIEHLAELATRYPSASDMFANYLARSLRIEALGYYERVAESATHYARLLLKSRRQVQRSESEITATATRLVYAYKDHSFAIDASEAADIFGPDVVATNSSEYKIGNRLYVTLDMLDYFLGTFFSRTFAFMGGADEGAVLVKKTGN